MHNSKLNLALRSLITALVCLLILSCASKPNVIGRWREKGKSATLEFWKDGTFTAVDNEGMAVRGNYTLDERGNIRFEVTLPGPTPDVVNGKITLRGDELTIEFSDHNEMEKYKREE